MKKKFFIALLLLLFPLVSYASSNPYPKTQKFNGIVNTPCTRVAWQEAYDRLGISLPSWGNAVNWYKNASDAGYQVGYEAKINAIAVYSGFYGYGHVAYVINVTDESMTVVENNFNEEGKIESTRSKGIGSGEESGLYLIGFIYINEGKANNKVSSSSSSEEKSSNSYLKSIEISDINIDFTKDNYYYEINVGYETDKVKIKATPLDSSAKVKYVEDNALNVGNNIIEIKVTAKDNSESTYILNINREDEIKTVVTDEENSLNQSNEETPKEELNYDKSKANSPSSFVFPICICVILLLVVILIIFKKKNEKLH